LLVSPGEVAVLLKKQADEIEKLKKSAPQDMQASTLKSESADDKKKSKFTLRRYLLLKKFQKRVKILLIIIRFCVFAFQKTPIGSNLQDTNELNTQLNHNQD